MPAPAFRDYLRTLVREEARPPHKFGHQARLYALTQAIGQGLSYLDDVVFAAVWLHDLGVFEGNRPADRDALVHWDHVRYATARSEQILAATDFPAASIPHVLAVIEQHQPKDTPTTLEATIVRDADILEQLGAISILRTASKLAGDTRFVQFSDVSHSLTHQLNHLPAQLNLPRSRELALPRQQALQDFLSSLETEADGNLD